MNFSKVNSIDELIKTATGESLPINLNEQAPGDPPSIKPKPAFEGLSRLLFKLDDMVFEWARQSKINSEEYKQFKDLFEIIDRQKWLSYDETYQRGYDFEK